jgi:AcrR family transcriptional regulator
MVELVPVDTNSQSLGLRERKKQQQRDAIAEAALRLFAERGYDKTTLADIAEAADISPRTIFAYYESKQDILFCEESSSLEELKQKLEQRPPGTTTVDAIRELVSTVSAPDEQALLRKRILADSPALQMQARAHIGQLEPVLAASIARDLEAGPDDIRPSLLAAVMIAALSAVRDRFMDAEVGQAVGHEQAMAMLDEVLEFMRGGLEALQRD